MQDYMSIASELKKIRDSLSSINDEIEDTYTKGKQVLEKLSSKDNWSGEAQKVAVAYIDLVLQYHSKFTTENENGSPLEQAIEAFDEFERNNDVFYNNWEDYQQVNGI